MAFATPSISMRFVSRSQGLVISLMLVVLGLLAVTSVWHDQLFHASSAVPTANTAEAASTTGPKLDSATTVILPEGKFEQAGIRFSTVDSTELPTEVTVAGQITANPDRYIDIHPPSIGVIRSVTGEIGGKVKKGDPLVVLDSAEVGKARLDLRARQRELATARAEAEWKREVAKSVDEIIPLLRQNMAAKEISAKFMGKSFGSFRALLLGGYADLEIARHEEEKQTDLFKKEIVGEHPYYLAIHTREGKQAKFEAELEQVHFDSTQQRKLADLAVRNSEAAVIDAAQRLRLLGVTEDLVALLSPTAISNVTTPAEFEDVTRYVVTAPFDGSILARTATISQRVELTDILFTIADTADVRVQANFPESELGSLPKLKDAKVRLTAAAYPGRIFEATVVGIGNQVNPETRTVPVRATLHNSDELLKIGMFVRIMLDSSTSENALTVPSGAVVEIDEQSGVFVPDADPRTFHFRKVKVGRDVDGKRVLKSGLAAGAKVVSLGAFLLKSELILQNETDEE